MIKNCPCKPVELGVMFVSKAGDYNTGVPELNSPINGRILASSTNIRLKRLTRTNTLGYLKGVSLFKQKITPVLLLKFTNIRLG